MTDKKQGAEPWSAEEIERIRVYWSVSKFEREGMDAPPPASERRWLATLDQVTAELQKARAEIQKGGGK